MNASSRTATKSRARISARNRGPEFTLVPSLWKPKRDFNGLTFTDIFCGAGGSSLGLTNAGLRLEMAANHWQRAIETHASNFTDADHKCANVNLTDFRRFPKTNVLWASPICTEMSPAGGGTSKSVKARPKRATVDGQGSLELEEYGHIESEGYERTRATFWDVIRADEVHDYDAIVVENVPDVAEKWDLFGSWFQILTEVKGKNGQLLSVNTAHVGGPGNPHAPQWRDRLYVVFTKKGIPLPDIEPRPVAHCFQCGETVKGVQCWIPAATKRRFKVGRYRRDPNSSYGQYWYVCPNARCRGARVEPYVLPAKAAIDWSDLGELIADRPQPLRPNTTNRIKAGLRKHYLEPLLATVAGNTYERPGSGYVRASSVNGAPMPTQTTTAAEALIHPPMLMPVRGNMIESHASANYTRSLRTDDAPMHTLTTSLNDAVITPPAGAFYTMSYSAEKGRNPDRMSRSVSEPLGAQTATNSHGVVTPPTFAVNANHGEGDVRLSDPYREPLDARTTKISEMLVTPPQMMVPIGGSWAEEILDTDRHPMRTQTANPKGFESVVTPDAHAFMTILRNHQDAESVSGPLQTLTTTGGGNDHYLTIPPGTFYVQNYGGYAQPHQVVHGVDGYPLGPVTTRDHHALVVPYYTKGLARTAGEPFDAMTTRDRFNLVRPEHIEEFLAKVDLDELVQMCRYRMLKPREALNAQRFDADYVVTGNIGEQTMQAGNAVSANVAQMIGEALAKVLCESDAR